MVHGKLTYSISDLQKVVLGLFEHEKAFTNELLISKVRGIVDERVLEGLRKIMVVGVLSYFDIDDNQKKQISEIFQKIL